MNFDSSICPTCSKETTSTINIEEYIPNPDRLMELLKAGSEQELTADDRKFLVDEINHALKEEQFEVWAQPQVDHSNNGTLIGAEALVRWRHPQKGLIPPGMFIPILENNKLIYELDKYVWRFTCKTMRKWHSDGMPNLPISINVSRNDMLEPDFLDVILSNVKKYNIPPQYLHIEITESAFSEDIAKISYIVKELITNGFTIAIDDFGSGYSSLSLLRNVPAHIVKLDMSFFADGENQSRNECIIESIIRMVKMLGMAVLAEGVEIKEQADKLRALGCAYIQGYLYSKPLPYEEFRSYVKSLTSKNVNDHSLMDEQDLDVASVQSYDLFHSIISGTNDAIIVSDIETKELLYANRAAEEYFGKRFDPLNPTTCIKYCARGNVCKDCPANGMKEGEKREHILCENGTYIKSLYVQMDWNGHDAVAFYQTDISEEMREFAIDEIRYNRFIEQTKSSVDHTFSIMHFNLTHDTCKSVHRDLEINRPVVFSNGINGFVRSVLGNIANDADRAAFEANFTKEALINCFETGEFYEKMRLPIKLKDGRIVWCYQEVNISKNPKTGDIEAISILSEADRHIRLTNFYKKLIQRDYELVGSIDSRTGLVTIVFEPDSHNLPNIYGIAVHYSTNLVSRMTSLVEDQFIDLAVQANSFDNILKNLETQEDYMVMFPAKKSILGDNGSFRWRYSYVDDSKQEIMFTRKAMT